VSLWQKRIPEGRAREQIQVIKSEKAHLDGCTERGGKMPLSLHVIGNKAKQICKLLIADAGEGEPEKISCSLEAAHGK